MTSSWMIVAGFLFAATAVLVKIGSEQFRYDGAELAFYRSIFTVAFAIVFVGMTRGRTLRSPHMGSHIIRGVVGAISLMGYFYAITRLPVSTAQTLNYTSPIFLAIATTVVLGERFSGWLVVAIVLGFVGVAMLLQPHFEAGKEGPAMIGLFSGVLAAWAYLAVRTLGRLGEPDWRVVFWFGFIAAVMCAAWQVATGGFHAITLAAAPVLLGIGLCGTLAQLAMTRAYRTGNTLVVGALSYSAIVFATLASVAFFENVPSAFEWVGMAVIVASGILAMRVEKKVQVKEALES